MPSRVTFVLVSPRNPKNIGASARGMANFGFRNLSVVKPYAVAWRETRSAVNASAVVEKAKKFDSLKAAIRAAHVVIGTSAGSRRNADVRWIGPEQARSIVETNRRAKKSVAIVFGSERSGLSNDDLAYCHYVLRLPTSPDCPSMNLSQAVAVTACAIRDENTGSTGESKWVGQTSVEQVERLVERAHRAFESAGLLRGWDRTRSVNRIRKAFFRWNLTEDDVAMLHGVLGWMLKTRR